MWKNRKYVALLSIMVLFSCTVEAQATHVVTIWYCPDVDICHFGPSQLTIAAGDTVQWRRRYGGDHDITWSAEEFPASSSFPHSLNFDRPGTFEYRCTIHGKKGSIKVTGNPDVTEPFAINSGLSDAWHDPDRPGQGFFITVLPDLGQVFLAWFTYDIDRPAHSASATIGDPEHRWLTAFGPYADNHAVLDIEITDGGVFNAATPAPTQYPDGSVILDFSDCRAGTVAFDIPSIHRRGVIPIRRISDGNAAACEALAAAPQAGRGAAISMASKGGATLAPTGSLINRGLNDAWYSPAIPGQGFFFNVFPELGQMFLAWFTFDTARPPESVRADLGDPGHRWFTAYGAYSGNRAELDIEVTEGGEFNSSSPRPTQREDGELTVDMTDCENGTITYDIHSANLQGQIPIKRLAPDNVLTCQSLAQ